MNLFQSVFGRCCILCGKTVDPRSPEVCAECSAKIEKNHLLIPLSERRYALSVYYFGDPIRRGLHRFKYGGKKGFGIYLGRKLAERYRQRGDVADVVTCVPRAIDGKARIYNQSAVIARTMASELKLPFDPNLLRKRIGALTQPECPTILAREENARKSYYNGTSSRDITGLRVLLVDDLYTTGATARACCDVLELQGAKGTMVYTGIYDRAQPVTPLVANFDQVHVYDDFSNPEKYRKRKYKKRNP